MPLVDSYGCPIGQLIAVNKLDAMPFDDTDEELLSTLCAQVALGIEKAEAYERERSIAETLQQAILAVPSSLPSVEVGTTYQSAAEAAKVGGDFYDLFELTGGDVGFLIGDISGKGLEAATTTSMLKSTIRAFTHKGISPAMVLTEANKAICEQLRHDQFATVIYGVLNPQTGRVTICCAGHPDAIIWSKSRCSLLGVNSNLPLGAFSDTVYKQNEIEVSCGDAIILYTDGLTEARCEGKLMGWDMLIEKLEQTLPVKSPQQVANELAEMAKQFACGKPQDDIAVLVIKVKPEKDHQITESLQ